MTHGIQHGNQIGDHIHYLPSEWDLLHLGLRRISLGTSSGAVQAFLRFEEPSYLILIVGLFNFINYDFIKSLREINSCRDSRPQGNLLRPAALAATSRSCVFTVPMPYPPHTPCSGTLESTVDCLVGVRQVDK